MLKVSTTACVTKKKLLWIPDFFLANYFFQFFFYFLHLILFIIIIIYPFQIFRNTHCIISLIYRFLQIMYCLPISFYKTIALLQRYFLVSIILLFTSMLQTCKRQISFPVFCSPSQNSKFFSIVLVYFVFIFSQFSYFFLQIVQ